MALHKVFVRPIEQSRVQGFRYTPFFFKVSRSAPTTALLSQQQQRGYAKKAKPVVLRGPGTGKGPTIDRLPRDKEIIEWRVRVVDQNNKISEPRNTQDILDSLNPKEYSLCVVQAATRDSPPVCKIMSKKDMFDAQKKKKREKAKKNPARKTKKLELNWALDENDLGIKLRAMKSFLGKGFKVEVMCAGRKKKQKTARVASEEECGVLLNRIREAIAECEGAKEHKVMEGKIGASVTIFVAGKVPKKLKEVDGVMVEEEVEDEEEDEEDDEDEEKEVDQQEDDNPAHDVQTLPKRRYGRI